MPIVTPKIIATIPSSHMRNICILAHVDHGKTTLSDSLIATNGIISSKMAGKVRYLDSRDDEQQRGITMKSSAIALYFQLASSETSEQFLINLIDSPGHVDFASEVSTASKLCDAALILVDVVEGVCTQTHTVLRQAWTDGLTPLLVLNKLDRLVVELRMRPTDAHLHVCRILEAVNALMGTLWHRAQTDDAAAEEEVYFSPERGNVVFASAVDGWAFRPAQFVPLYATKLGVKPELLQKVLWGDYYLDLKTKRVLEHRHLKGRAMKPMFVQFVLEPIWAVYDAVLLNYNRDKIEKIATTLGLKLLPRDVASKDHRALLQTMFSQWLPLSSSVLLAVAENLPSPAQQGVRLAQRFPASPVQDALQRCNAHGPVVAFVSKLFHASSASITRMKDDSEMTLEQRRAARMDAARKRDLAENLRAVSLDESTDLLVGFARIYSGTISVGDALHLLLPRHVVGSTEHCVDVSVTGLYLLMGRELQEVQSVRAGQVFGISGLENVVMKAGTLASHLNTPSLAAVGGTDKPIVRCAVEPVDPSQMPQLIAGLTMLSKADPSVEVELEENGQHVLCTAGELHLERCLKDLKDLFGRVDVVASEPIVPFRETIVAEKALPGAPRIEEEDGSVYLITANKAVGVRVKAVPLSEDFINQLLDSTSAIKSALDNGDSALLDSFNGWPKGVTREMVWAFGPRRVGPNLLVNAIPGYDRMPWPGGKLKDTETIQQTNDSEATIKDLDGSIVTGFQLATLSGPLCAEPMQGVCFIIESVDILAPIPHAQLVQAHGQVMTTVAQACRNAFQCFSSRIMLAMYSCDVQATAEVLGKVYGVLARRRGKVLGEAMKDGTDFFQVTATLPVVESFGFADGAPQSIRIQLANSVELRKKTSGAANPQLIFSGYQVLPQDPYWVPTTEEELEDLGEKADRENLARKYVDKVRKRKGLLLEKMVERAEQQRTQKR